MTLGEKDYAILKTIAQTGFQTTKEIREGGYKGRNRTSILKRLHSLAHAGYLQERPGENGTILGWTLSARRAHEVFVNYKEVLEGIGKVPTYRTAFHHDMTLREIRSALTKSPGIVQWVPEHILKSEIMRNFSYLNRRDRREKLLLVPDALLHLESGGEQSKGALELELTQKERRRVRQKLEAYIVSPDFDYVFFIARDESLMGHLKDVYDEVVSQSTQVKFAKQQNRIYFCTLDEVQKLGIRAAFVSDGDSLRFDELGG